MKFDVFFSICQNEVEGRRPTERTMFENFFDQVALADELGYDTAWVAETHLSCEIQKHGPAPVIPHFRGEIGLNTDILQLAHVVYARTKRIEVGSAIRNILCNGGPVAHAEAIRTFLTLHGLNRDERRRLNIGFAAGRFEFSNRPYGIRPRNAVEASAWPVVKGKILAEATEIFLRLIEGEQIARADVPRARLTADDFRTPEEWAALTKLAGQERIELEPFWEFDRLGVIPFEAPLELLDLTLGSHDPRLQVLANRIRPVSVFNLSITPPEVIEATHARLREVYHPRGGGWTRDKMPRTAMVFLDATPGWSEEARTHAAHARAEAACRVYWQAMEGTIDFKKVNEAVNNALVGSPERVAEQIARRFHPEDRLMLWFDFNTHDNALVKTAMRDFQEHVVPLLQ